MFAGKTLLFGKLLRRLIPLTELRQEDVVGVGAHAGHTSGVDLELVQMRRGVHLPRGGSPVVLPEPGPQTVLQDPVDRCGIAVDPHPLPADHKLPGAQIRRQLLPVLLQCGVVVDGHTDRRTDGTACGRMQFPPRLACATPAACPPSQSAVSCVPN